MPEPHMPEQQLDPEDYWPPKKMEDEEPSEERDREYWTKYDNFGEDCSPK